MPTNMMNYNEELRHLSPAEILEFFSARYPGKTVFSTSLGADDQVITHMIVERKLPVRIFTLDTGRLFPETYELLDITVKKYQYPIEVYYPDAVSLQKMVTEKGINLFYDSLANRQLCCAVRKTEPLKKALKDAEIWICGLRHEQSENRSGLELTEWDEEHDVLKVYPLLTWTDEQVWEYIRENKVPYNPLHDKKYPSIGCQPCTRAVETGEDTRSGRWWWEEGTKRECGLHVRAGK
ncbi:MAG TPA: phosphoadenylyl-sulfate reductase [Bacteroidales bacterium]|nr:phosphoadenylyl-sulfate reductase [Bacteroidales bacterium]